MKKRLMVSLVPAIALFAFAAPALASTQEAVSENWAGYVATPGTGSGFSGVSGEWKQPTVDCSTADQATYSAYWVGIGGGGSNSSALEQIGTQADCDGNGNTDYYAWYELVPSAPVKLKLQINPGDTVYARTVVKGDQVTLRIVDETSGHAWGRSLTMTSATPDISTAEWVAEAPSECQGGATSGDCTPLTLADFGTAQFSDAHATAGGHTGTISDPQFQHEAIALEPSSSSLFGGGNGGFFGAGGDSSFFGNGYGTDASYSSTATGSAAPTALTSNGTAFTVKYGSTADSDSTGTGDSQGQSSQDQGYGYSGGYGDGYGYSDGSGDSYGYGDGGYTDGYGDGGYSDGYGDYGDSDGYGDSGSGQSFWGY
jgi:Peptidase A4 family